MDWQHNHGHTPSDMGKKLNWVREDLRQAEKTVDQRDAKILQLEKAAGERELAMELDINKLRLQRQEREDTIEQRDLEIKKLQDALREKDQLVMELDVDTLTQQQQELKNAIENRDLDIRKLQDALREKERLMLELKDQDEIVEKKDAETEMLWDRIWKLQNESKKRKRSD